MKHTTTRRTFIAAGAALAATTLTAQTPKENRTMANDKNILIAADPYAVSLKDAVAAHLKAKGYTVTDLSDRDGKALPYFESAVDTCKAIQAGRAPRAILFCGTGMGMSIVANRFKGVTASVVESVYAARMCRVINNANVLCLGQMIWGPDMAKVAVDTFLDTKFTEGFEGIADFLRDACDKVETIRP